MEAFMDDFNRKRHAVYKLTYHAVFVIKYRRKVMSEPIIDHMRQYAAHLIDQCYQGKLIELNGEPDHIHILFDAGPEVQVLDLVRVIKTKTARFARKQYPKELKEYFWKPVFWTDSYFASTVGNTTRNMVEQYIRKQGQKQT